MFFLFPPLFRLLPVAIIIIAAIREHQILSNGRPVRRDSPEAPRDILPEGARELLGVLMTGVGTPNTWRQLLPNTRADGSDGRQSTRKRHHNVNMNVSYMNYQIFMPNCKY